MSNNLAARMFIHAAAAAAIFFVFHRHLLSSSWETSSMWAVVGAVGAAALAWSQHRRGS